MRLILVLPPTAHPWLAGKLEWHYLGTPGSARAALTSLSSKDLTVRDVTASALDRADLYVTKGPIFDSGPEAVLRYDGTTGAFVELFIPENSGGLLIPLSLAFRPVSATSHVDSLMVAVGNLRLPSGTGNSLNASLEGARAAIDQGRLIPAGNRLHAFTKRSKPTRAS